MCGRYALDQNARELANHFDLVSVPVLVPRYNIPPGTPVLVIRRVPEGRIGEPMLWGFQPAWSRRTGGAGPKPINARGETAATSPMFRGSFRHHRCLLPASGFYEWQRAGAAKQPWYIHGATGGPLAFAGLFDPGDDGAAPTCCILTTTANALMAPIHDRMPVLLDAADFAAWLDPATDAREMVPLLRPCPPEWLRAHPVSRAVNTPRNDSATLIEPLA